MTKEEYNLIHLQIKAFAELIELGVSSLKDAVESQTDLIDKVVLVDPPDGCDVRACTKLLDEALESSRSLGILLK